ncbi:glycine betaine/L-proline ABC transporter ATP-binding protein ProV [Notoacmeibacter ruber]|uniref:Quaternary amine transport ATP-binding protein n=1 Tax=Notoacmeibacter ruber TaxID=2670375 RepID=A0A3L7J8C0_9HYPH|nr:glycine betaine/L-proline ABC transporter ATP-binding protein ProV [Notoacmeibacter ruber]RLQ86913.1 proline/glycine betaine ABC transporter ATP-binding protein ProV [Notoacmeibacter ruber]
MSDTGPVSQSESSSDVEDALTIRNLYKVFGDDPKEAISLYKSGKDKDEVFADTGMVIGVCDASFAVRKGEIFVVMGLSGSGKSTLVRMLNRLIEPTEGEIIVGDQNIAAMSEKELNEFRRKHISMVFQSFALMPHMTVLQNAAFGLDLSGVPTDQREKRAQAALEQVGLGAHGKSYPNELSGGMQQRVGLARALANDPTILLMDEAFSALDPLIRTEMQDELLQLQAEDRRTIVFISHDLDEAMRIGDRIAIMQGGRVVQVGTPDDILHRPANDYVSSFFKGVNVQNVITVGDIAAQGNYPVLKEDTDVQSAIAALDRDGFAYIVDRNGAYIGTVSHASLQALNSGSNVSAALLPEMNAIKRHATLTEIITPVAKAPAPVPIIENDGTFIGTVGKDTLLEAMSREGTANE